MDEKCNRIDFEESNNVLQELSVRISVLHIPSTVV